MTEIKQYQQWVATDRNEAELHSDTNLFLLASLNATEGGAISAPQEVKVCLPIFSLIHTCELVITDRAEDYIGLSGLIMLLLVELFANYLKIISTLIKYGITYFVCQLKKVVFVTKTILKFCIQILNETLIKIFLFSIILFRTFFKYHPTAFLKYQINK